jgi:HK97 gp10 family phage protein
MDIQWHGDEFKEQLHNKLGDSLDDAAMEIDLKAAENCPVDTGALQESLRHETDRMELKADIGSDLEYCRYVEEGTRKMAAQPFLKPALYEVNVEQYFRDLM